VRKLISLEGAEVVCFQEIKSTSVSEIRSVFTAIPLFYLSVFKAPDSVYKKFISIQRRFLWGWGRDRRAISWVSWENLCRAREEGGLGIKDVRCFNYALLAKWKWWLQGHERGKWKDIINSKYGSVLGQPPTPIKYQSWGWRDLIKVCGEEGMTGWFNKAVGWMIGAGTK